MTNLALLAGTLTFLLQTALFLGSASDSGTDLYYGVGASYDFGKIRFVAEFVRYVVDDIDADVIAAGIEYKF